MRKHIFKEGLPPSERNRKTVGYRNKIDGNIIDDLGVVANEYANPDAEASAKLIQFLKEKDFIEYNNYFSKNFKAFGDSYEIIIPFEVDTDYYEEFATVTRWVIVPNLGYNKRVEYGQKSSTKYSNFFNKSALRLIDRFSLQQLTIYTGDDRNGKDRYVGYGLCTLETHENRKSVKPIELVNKLKAFVRRLEMVNAEYEKTANLGAKEYYTYKGKLPNNNLQINVFYVDGENGCTIEYDCEVLGENLKCYVESENSAVGLDLEEPTISEPFFEVLAEEGIIEEEDVRSLAEEFENDGTYNYLQIFDVTDWPKYFELVGEFLKANGFISEYNVEVNRDVNPRRKNRIKNNPNLRQQYESRISKISRRMREAEEDWDDLGYDEADAGVEDYDDPNEVLDGEDYFTYDDPAYTGMNDGERAYDHYDSDMEDVIADSMPTRKKGLGIGKKRGDSSYFNKDYLDSPDMWDENGDNVPEEIEWKLTKKVAESKKPFKTRLY